MFNENAFKEQIDMLPIPTDKAQVRFDPPDATHYRDGPGHPSMYLLNAPLKSYFYSTEMLAFLSLDLSEELSYNFTWWFGDNKFAVSFVDLNELYCEETVPLRDTIKFGIFHCSEEEHFQDECLKGTPLSWEMEQIIQKKLADLSEFYMDQYYNDFLQRSE